jgi:hypothetical protein
MLIEAFNSNEMSYSLNNWIFVEKVLKIKIKIKIKI